MFASIFTAFPRAISSSKFFKPSIFSRKIWDLPLVPVKKDLGPIEAEILNSSVAANFIAGYDQNSFTLSTGTKIVGPCVLLPMNVFHWNVAHSLEISEETLAMFFVLEPKLDFLVIGKGTIKDKVDYDGILKLADKYNIGIEILPTVNAIGTFNIMNQEERYVGAALIPPHRIDIFDQDYEETKRIKAREATELQFIDSANQRLPQLETWSDRRKKLIKDKTNKPMLSDSLKDPLK